MVDRGSTPSLPLCSGPYPNLPLHVQYTGSVMGALLTKMLKLLGGRGSKVLGNKCSGAIIAARMDILV